MEPLTLQTGTGGAHCKADRGAMEKRSGSAAHVRNEAEKIVIAGCMQSNDGWRIQLHKNDNLVRLYTKSGYDSTRQFVGLTTALAAVPARSCIIDGETRTWMTKPSGGICAQLDDNRFSAPRVVSTQHKCTL
jgi:hypothetical protein